MKATQRTWFLVPHIKHNLGSVLVLIPPLLVGSESGGSLRGDFRSGFGGSVAFTFLLFQPQVGLSQGVIFFNHKLPEWVEPGKSRINFSLARLNYGRCAST